MENTKKSKAFKSRSTIKKEEYNIIDFMHNNIPTWSVYWTIEELAKSLKEFKIYDSIDCDTIKKMLKENKIKLK